MVDAAVSPRGREPLQVRVLGPVEASRGDILLKLGGPLEKKLLGVLAISPNRAVSIDALAQALWGDHPPASRDNSVQTYVSRLRGALGTAVIRSEDHSYELVVAAGELDSLVFADLARRIEAATGSAERCVALCSRALALWRGRPFGDFADEDPFRIEVIRLEELRMAIVESQVRAEMLLGNEVLVVGLLEGLVVEYPYRERLWQLLMLALALSGRRVEALRAGHALWSSLADIGLVPGPAVRRIEEAILTEATDLRGELALLGNGDQLAAN